MKNSLPLSKNYLQITKNPINTRESSFLKMGKHILLASTFLNIRPQCELYINYLRTIIKMLTDLSQKIKVLTYINRRKAVISNYYIKIFKDIILIG